LTGILNTAGVEISLDGRRRRIDNQFVERLWRSLKHEGRFVKGSADAREATAASFGTGPSNV